MMTIGELAIEVTHKAIKNLHLNVLPPDGRVRVSVPLNMSETAIRMAVVKRIPWIRRQQRSFLAQPRQGERELVSGESHYLWGQHYRLTLIERSGKHQVRVRGKRLELQVSHSCSPENRAKVLLEWYRQQVKDRMPALLDDWQSRLGVTVSEWGVKKMKTKWGTCNREAGRIWVNLDLAKKPPECLEYIVVHELVHLIERHHNARFEALMDQHLPRWRESRALLKSLPLGHESWAGESVTDRTA